MASHARETRVLPADIRFFIGKLRGIGASGLKYTYNGEGPIPNGVQVRLSHSISFSSWGEDITVTMTAQGNQTLVDIFSTCSMPTQIIDYGKNKENVAVIFNYLMQGMPVYRQTYAQPQPQQSANGRVCPNCGKQLDNISVYCTNCGTKVQ